MVASKLEFCNLNHLVLVKSFIGQIMSQHFQLIIPQDSSFYKDLLVVTPEVISSILEDLLSGVLIVAVLLHEGIDHVMILLLLFLIPGL